MRKARAINALVMVLVIGPVWIAALLNHIPWHSRPETIVVTPHGPSQTVQWFFRDQEQAREFADYAAPTMIGLGGTVPRREGGKVTARLPVTRTPEGSIVVRFPAVLVPAGDDWILRVRLSPYHGWKASTATVSLPALGYTLVEGSPAAILEATLSDRFWPTSLIYFVTWVFAAFCCALALAFRLKSCRPEERKSLLVTFSGLAQVPATLGLAVSSVFGVFEALSIQFGTLLAGFILLACISPVILAGIFPLRQLANDAGRAESWASHAVALVLQVTPLLLFLIVRVAIDTPLTRVAGQLGLGAWGLSMSEIIVYACTLALTPFILLRLLPVTRGRAILTNGTPAPCEYWVLRVGDTGMANAFVIGFWPRSARFIVTDRLLMELAPDELQAVLAHEKGHVHHWHLVKLQTIYLTVVMAVRIAIAPGPWELPETLVAGVAGLIALPLAVLVTYTGPRCSSSRQTASQRPALPPGEPQP